MSNPDTRGQQQTTPASQWSAVKSSTPKKLLSLVISGALLLLIYRRIDFTAMLGVLAESDVTWLTLSIGMILPITALNALRFQWAATSDYSPHFTSALRLTLISVALNLFLPAKLGDLAKSHFLSQHHAARAGVAVSVVVYERLCDMFAVTLWCLIGWLSISAVANLEPLILPAAVLWILSAVLLCSGKTIGRLLHWLMRFQLFQRREQLTLLIRGWPDHHSAVGYRGIKLVLFSLAAWLLHITQLWTFTVAVGAEVPFTAGLALFPFALLCSLVPFTLAGIGPRDAAIIYLFTAYMSPETAAAVGLLTITRGLIPSLLALPFLPQYLQNFFRKPQT